MLIELHFFLTEAQQSPHGTHSMTLMLCLNFDALGGLHFHGIIQIISLSGSCYFLIVAVLVERLLQGLGA